MQKPPDLICYSPIYRLCMSKNSYQLLLMVSGTIVLWSVINYSIEFESNSIFIELFLPAFKIRGEPVHHFLRLLLSQILP